MKEIYRTPELEAIVYHKEDIIRTSDPNELPIVPATIEPITPTIQ